MNYIYNLSQFLKHLYSKYINFFFFQVKPMKLSLVEKNILKSTGYKCYCTGMKH